MVFHMKIRLDGLMDMQRLRYFVAVEERHITRAAARLGMAQPPLSQQIRILETDLGTRLFDRLPRGVALTPAGDALLEDARALLDAADRAWRRAQRIRAGEEGELAVGLTTSAARSICTAPAACVSRCTSGDLL